MPDYYSLEQLALKMGLSESKASELLAKGDFSPAVKNGRSFYSARQVHQLLAALRLARKHSVSFEEGLQMVLARASRIKQGSAV